MNDPIEIPSKGAPMKADWGAGVSRAVNSLMLSGPSDMLVRDGAGGFSLTPLPRNLRDKRGGSAPADHSVFRFKTTKDNNDALHYWIVDCYYNYGARTRQIGDVELDKNQDWFDKFAALVIPFDDYPSIKPYDSLEDLQLAQSRYSQYVFPLYKFAAADDEDESPVLKVETDLRMAPQIQVFE